MNVGYQYVRVIGEAITYNVNGFRPRLRVSGFEQVAVFGLTSSLE